MASKAQHRPVTTTNPSVGYILSPRLDFWMTGGVSILVMCALLVYVALTDVSTSASQAAVLGNMVLFQALINWPHFMGSYSLLYRPAENIKKHPFASIYVPLVLIGIVIASVVVGEEANGSAISVNQDIAYLFWLAAAFYLAWHYTGQAWGMIATFSRLSNLELAPRERVLVRLGLRSLLVWHVVWGAQDLPAEWLFGMHAYVPKLLSAMNILCGSAFLVGAAIWIKVSKRIGKMPDARILASWLSIYLWYLVLFFMPEAYPFVQLSHALQYLGFPLRVELNRNVPLGDKHADIKSVLWSFRYSLLLIGAGLVVFYLPNAVSTVTEKYTFAIMIASAVSIHHYFVDGCIWKVGNPDVRRRLFAHLSIERPGAKPGQARA